LRPNFVGPQWELYDHSVLSFVLFNLRRRCLLLTTLAGFVTASSQFGHFLFECKNGAKLFHIAS
jgi:hypothetical protein